MRRKIINLFILFFLGIISLLIPINIVLAQYESGDITFSPCSNCVISTGTTYRVNATYTANTPNVVLCMGSTPACHSGTDTCTQTFNLPRSNNIFYLNFPAQISGEWNCSNVTDPSRGTRLLQQRTLTIQGCNPATYNINPTPPANPNSNMTVEFTLSSDNTNCMVLFKDSNNVPLSDCSVPTPGVPFYRCNVNSGNIGIHTLEARYGQTSYYPPGTTCGSAMNCPSTSYEVLDATINPTRAPTPTLYPTIQIRGNFQEDIDRRCSSLNINPSSLLMRIMPVSPAGVTPVCSKTATDYTCNITFDNQKTPSVATNQDLYLSAIYPGYPPIKWKNPDNCSGSDISYINVNALSNSTYDQDMFFTNNFNWFKLSNASFVSKNTEIINNILPGNVEAYDSDDNTTKYLVVNNAGLVLNYDRIDLGPNASGYSDSNWRIGSYSPTNDAFISDFIDYLKSRKEYKSIRSIADIVKNKVNLMDCSPSLCEVALNNGDLSKAPYVLIVRGNVTITQNEKFNQSNKAIAIITTGTIAFDPDTNEARGLFIADRIDTRTSNQELKIIGNLISSNPLEGQRTRNDNNSKKPSLFIVFNPRYYVELLPYLSTSRYDWKQLQ